MPTAHAHHIAIRLADGRVLVAGGVISDQIDGQVSRMAELFDPTAGTWSITGAMVEPRWGHGAVLLADGQVLAVGGAVHGADGLSSTEVYDPNAATWSASGPMSVGRGGHTATALPDGSVLVAGGWTTARPAGVTLTERFDPDSGSWRTAAPMLAGRQGHTATALRDGRVLVVGGAGEVSFEEGPSYSATAELYDPLAGRWTVTGSLAMARAGHTATLLADGTVLVVGGSAGDERTARSAELYDPSTGIWTVMASLADARSGHTATLLLDGTVLVAGGVGLGSDPRQVASAELFDPRLGTWARTQDLSAARSGETATLLLDGRVLVAGDYREDTGTSAEIYDPGGGS